MSGQDALRFAAAMYGRMGMAAAYFFYMTEGNHPNITARESLKLLVNAGAQILVWPASAVSLYVCGHPVFIV
jgi:hypothetical protein